jgi:F-type H+-transporting ATPase subunit alpha
MPVERQVVSLYLGINGLFDDVPVAEVRRFEKEILDYIEVNYNNVYESIKKEKQLNDAAIADIKKAAQETLATFKASA